MHTVWVAHASRVLVLASRRNNLFLAANQRQQIQIGTKVRDREDALANTGDARATHSLTPNTVHGFHC
jgi:hypothetical protein